MNTLSSARTACTLMIMLAMLCCTGCARWHVASVEDDPFLLIENGSLVETCAVTTHKPGFGAVVYVRVLLADWRPPLGFQDTDALMESTPPWRQFTPCSCYTVPRGGGQIQPRLPKPEDEHSDCVVLQAMALTPDLDSEECRYVLSLHPLAVAVGPKPMRQPAPSGSEPKAQSSNSSINRFTAGCHVYFVKQAYAEATPVTRIAFAETSFDDAHARNQRSPSRMVDLGAAVPLAEVLRDPRWQMGW